MTPTDSDMKLASEYYSLFGSISPSFIQYKLKVTYSMANAIIENLKAYNLSK